MSERLVVVGAGGFGRETLDVVEAMNAAAPKPLYELLGVIDDQPAPKNVERLSARDIPYLGTVDSWLTRSDDAHFVVAVGSPQARVSVVSRIETARRDAATLIHPSAVIGSVGAIGPGTIICAGAQISTNVTIGRHVHINPNATIGHDSVLADFVSVNPAATISGECQVRGRSLIGAAATVLQGIVIGECALVGASACVVRDVPAETTVKGVPAR